MKAKNLTTRKCSVCGREMSLTRNDAEDVFVFKNMRFYCGSCYLKERYKNESKQVSQRDDAH